MCILLQYIKGSFKFPIVVSIGMVTAEMFQSLENCEVMHKMTEKFDEVGPSFPKAGEHSFIGLRDTWGRHVEGYSPKLLRIIFNL